MAAPSGTGGQGVDQSDAVPSFECPALRQRQELEASLIAPLVPVYGESARLFVLKCLKQLGYPDAVDAASREVTIPVSISAAAAEWRRLCDDINTARLDAMTAQQRAEEAARLAQRDEVDRRTLAAFKSDIRAIGSVVILSRAMRADWISATSVWDRIRMLNTLGFMSPHEQFVLMNVAPEAVERVETVAYCIERVIKAHQEVWRTVCRNLRREGVEPTADRISCAYDAETRLIVSLPGEANADNEPDNAAAASGGRDVVAETTVVCDIAGLLKCASVDWSGGRTSDAVLGRHEGNVRGLCLYWGGDRAVSTDASGEMILWDVSASRASTAAGGGAAAAAGSSCEMKRFKAHSTETCGLGVSPDESQIVTGCHDGSVKLWTADGDAVRTLREAPDGTTWVRSVCFSADGQRVLAAGYQEKALLEFDVDGVRAVRVIPAGGALWAVDASADGQWVVTTDEGGHVKIWDGTSLTEMRTLDGSGSARSHGARFSPDSSRVAVASNDHHLRVWQTSDWSKTIDIKAHSSQAYQVCWSSDSKQFVTSGFDKTVKVWEASSGRLLRTLTGHTAWAWGVAMSDDGKMIMSNSYDKTVRVWKHAD